MEMASSDVSGDGDAPPKFDDICKEDEDEDVVETELQEPEFFEVKYEEEYLDEEEYLVEAEEVSEAEMASEAEVALEAEPYFEYNEPAPAVTITAVWDDQLNPLPMRSRSPPLLRAPYTSAAARPGSPSILTPFDDDIAMAEEHVFHLADEHQVMQQVLEVAAKHPQQQRCPRRGGAAPRGRGRGRGTRGQVPNGGPRWVRGERLIEVHIDDDDVPEDLRKMIMRVVKARLRATRAKTVRKENEEEWIDADDGEVQSFFAAEGTSNTFEWSPMGDYRGEREPFLPQQTGAVVASENAYGAFRQYWDDGIMSHIVTETNRHAAGLAASSPSFARDWYDTNIHELFILFSFWVMLGIIRMPSIKSCFTENPLLQTNIFRKLFSSSRYEILCRAFDLNDNSSRPTDSTDPLYSLGPIVDHLNARFKETYVPSQNICIDESLTLWKGNRSFRQYIKTKAARFGVKTFELCESSTGYIWSFFVYLGAGTSCDSSLTSTVRKSTSPVLNLIRPLLDQGYTLFMNNCFSSPLLARFLKTRKTDCVGTLRANRSNLPPLISLCKLKDGQFVARHSGDVVVLAFQDKERKIATISTYHGNSQGQMEAEPHRPSQYKPQIILDYNQAMGGVDREDQLLEPYLLQKKGGLKWNVKFFKDLLNCSIFNARILLHGSAAAPTKHIAFRLELVDQILRHHEQHVPKITPAHPLSSSLSHPKPQVQHFPRQTELANEHYHKRRRCLWCSQHQKYQRTTFMCAVCEVPLCIEPCFALYHKR